MPPSGGHRAKPRSKNVVCLFNEVRAADFTILCGAFGIVDYREELSALSLELTVVNESNGHQTVWVSANDAVRVEKMGYLLRDDINELYHSVAVLLSRNVQEFFGVQETKNLLDELEPKYPELLKETYRHATVQKVSEVFQRLLTERISVRNMKLILEAMAKWAPKEKDVITLVEHIRAALARYISDKFSNRGRLRAIVVSPNIEEIVRQGIRQTNTGVFLNLEPVVVEEIMDLFAVGLKSVNIAHKDMVLLASIDVRRFVKRLIESRYGELEVLSFGEVTDSISIDVIKTI